MYNRDDLSKVSMNGRMAYIILCIEKFLLTKYPEKNWKELSKRMWKVTSIPWDVWIDEFIEIIPQYLFEFDNYDESDFEELSEEEYKYYSDLYDGITEGLEDDSTDELNCLLNSLKELEEVYCYTSIPGIGEESLDIIYKVCCILADNNVSIPNTGIVAFSSFVEKNGWGETFDGNKLSLFAK